jgi:hypothetical protein
MRFGKIQYGFFIFGLSGLGEDEGGASALPTHPNLSRPYMNA